MRWPWDSADVHAFATNSAANQSQTHGYREKCQSGHSRCSVSGHKAHAESPCQSLARPNRGHKLLSGLGCRCDQPGKVSRLALFFAVHADHRLACGLIGFDQLMNFLKLLIAVGVAARAFTLDCLTTAKLVFIEQLVYHRQGLGESQYT